MTPQSGYGRFINPKPQTYTLQPNQTCPKGRTQSPKATLKTRALDPQRLKTWSEGS